MSKPKYKIVKEMGITTMRYYSYERCFFGLLWRQIGWDIDLKGAELAIEENKREKAKKNFKPELIGYYE